MFQTENRVSPVDRGQLKAKEGHFKAAKEDNLKPRAVDKSVQNKSSVYLFKVKGSPSELKASSTEYFQHVCMVRMRIMFDLLKQKRAVMN